MNFKEGKIMNRIFFVFLFVVANILAQDEWFNIGPTGYELVHIYDLEVLNADTILFTSGNKQLFLTENGGADWEIREVELVSSGHMSLDSHGNLYIAGLQAVVKSTDLGISWTRIDNDIPGLEYGLYIYNDILYVANETNLFYSSDYGNSWITTNFNHGWGSVQRNHEYLFATYYAMGHSGLSRSSDNGITWNPVSMSFGVATFHVSDENGLLLYSDEENIGLFYSSDNGDSWIHSDYFQSANNFVHAIYRTPSARYFVKVAGETQAGLYTSVNPVTGWKYIGLGDKENYAVAVDNETEIVYVGLPGEGIYYHVGPYTPVELIGFGGKASGATVKLHWSTSSEANNRGFEIERSVVRGQWQKVGFVDGHGTITEKTDYSYIDNSPHFRKNQYKLRQIDYNGSFQYSDIIEVDVLPVDFGLAQNFPNPFNPSTKIEYSIADAGNVTIRVYDATGSEVRKNSEGNKEVGKYVYEFKGGDLSSGIYFYELTVEDENGIKFRAVNKMLLLK